MITGKWSNEEVAMFHALRGRGLKLSEIAEKLGRSKYSVEFKSKLFKRDKISKSESIENVLVIFDLHAPFVKNGYLEFCRSMYKKHGCSSVIFTGDIADFHFSSYHETDADGFSAGEELDRAIEQLKGFHDAFPNSKVCLGNHDAIIQRKMATGALSKRWMRPLTEVLQVPTWEFAEEWIINKVKYIHGLGMKIRPRVMSEMCSCVQGHYHSDSEYVTFVNEKQMMFGLQGGCGVDRRSYAMAYGKHFKKPQINVGIVKDNGRWAILEHMPLGE